MVRTNIIYRDCLFGFRQIFWINELSLKEELQQYEITYWKFKKN